MSRDSVVYPSAEDYEHLEHRAQIYLRPEMVIGNSSKEEREQWVFDVQNGRMMNASIDFPPGAERLFLEVLSNASDSVGRSRRAGVDPGKIDITMDNETVSITNYGLPIPIEMHPKMGVYVPHMIFGMLNSSSNYTENRHEAGVNGVGAKAANIFSTQFAVIVHDHVRKLKYTQVWTNNMISICR